MSVQGLRNLKLRSIMSLAFVCVVVLSLARIHLRVQTTMIGYEIGQLKNQEVALLEQRANKNMELAKLTSKKHLRFISENGNLKTGRSKSIVSIDKNIR